MITILIIKKTDLYRVQVLKRSLCCVAFIDMKQNQNTPKLWVLSCMMQSFYDTVCVLGDQKPWAVFIDSVAAELFSLQAIPTLCHF
jgi:hypothetical protein